MSPRFEGIAVEPRGLRAAAAVVAAARRVGGLESWFFQRIFEHGEVRLRWRGRAPLGQRLRQGLGPLVGDDRPYELEQHRLGGPAAVGASIRFFHASSALALRGKADLPALAAALGAFAALRRVVGPAFFRQHVDALGQAGARPSLADFGARHPDLVRSVDRALRREPHPFQHRWEAALRGLALAVPGQPSLSVHVHLMANRIGLSRAEETLVALILAGSDG